MERADRYVWINGKEDPVSPGVLFEELYDVKAEEAIDLPWRGRGPHKRYSCCTVDRVGDVQRGSCRNCKKNVMVTLRLYMT